MERSIARLNMGAAEFAVSLDQVEDPGGFQAVAAMVLSGDIWSMHPEWTASRFSSLRTQEKDSNR